MGEGRPTIILHTSRVQGRFVLVNFNRGYQKNVIRYEYLTLTALQEAFEFCLLICVKRVIFVVFALFTAWEMNQILP